MMFLWKPQMVEYMTDVYEFLAPHQTIVKEIAPYLQGCSNVCDAGCGLGYLSLALSDLCEHVTAVDIAPGPLKLLRKNISDHHYKNIEIVEGDIHQLSPTKPYDAMVFNAFGGLLESLRIGKNQCSGRILLIKRNEEYHRFNLTPKHVKCNGFKSNIESLKSAGIPFYSEEFTLEMGQPFRSVQSAVDFFKLYNRDETIDTVNTEEILNRLTLIDSDIFPYYLETKRNLGMIVIEVEDIPDTIDYIKF